MFELREARASSKSGLYARLAEDLSALLGAERDPVANGANFASLLYHALPRVNWAGLYIYKEGELVLGPFQGKPACVRIRLGRGVCGTSAEKRETVLVDDVAKFPGHIACDAASRSEIVVPIVKAGRLIGVLDVDSPEPARFDAEDRVGLERLARIFVEQTEI